MISSQLVQLAKEWETIISEVGYADLTTQELKIIAGLKKESIDKIHTYFMSLSTLIFFSREVLAGLISEHHSTTKKLQLWTLIANFNSNETKQSLIIMSRQFIKWGRAQGYESIYGNCLEGLTVLERLRATPFDSSGFFEWRYNLQTTKDYHKMRIGKKQRK